MFKSKICFLLVVCIGLMAFLPSCNSGDAQTSSAEESFEIVDYAVQVKSIGGMELKDVEIRVFDKEDETDLIWGGNTQKDGTISFKAKNNREYVAVLNNLPQGYIAEDKYEITENTVISLNTSLPKGDEIGNRKIKSGDIMSDFSVADANGNVYNLSDVLKEKKAVVLNFWFLNCDPCKMEFPYLQKAYEKYSENVAVFALNPIDGTNETISEFADGLGLTFPMSVCDSGWKNCFDIQSYPTTVIIDRYGMVSMIHVGSVTQEGVFEKIFEYYISDNYVQQVNRNLSDID